MVAFPTYEFGTVSVANGGTTVIGDGVIWSGVNARAGDSISIDGGPFNRIDQVTDLTHLELVLPATADKTNVPYVVIWDSPLRYVGGQQMADVSFLISVLNSKGLLWYLPDGYTDPNDVVPALTADDGQGILRIDTGALWVMDGGTWISAGVYKGFNYKGAYNAATAYVANDVLTSGGSAYVVTAPTTGHIPPNVSYYDVLASKGDTGATGPTGDDATVAVGTVTGVAYGQPATVTNVGTPGAAIFDFEIPKGQDGAGIGDLVSVNNLSDLDDADTALDNLGGTTVGKAVFTAADAGAARSATNQSVTTKSANYTAVAGDIERTILLNGTFTLSLTAAATLTDKWRCSVKNIGTGIITLDPNASELIDGSATISLLPGQGCDLVCDGSAFHTLRLPNEIVTKLTASTQASLIVPIPAGYSYHELIIDELMPSSSAQLRMTASDNGGSSYLTSYNYSYTLAGMVPSSSPSSDGGTAVSDILLSGTAPSTGAHPISGRISLLDAASTVNAKSVTAETCYTSAGTRTVIRIGGEITTADPLTHIKLFMNTGNIASAKVTLWSKV